MFNPFRRLERKEDVKYTIKTKMGDMTPPEFVEHYNKVGRVACDILKYNMLGKVPPIEDLRKLAELIDWEIV